MTAILGISGLYHDSAAALVVDGEIVAAAQEERFSRRKHDADFPSQAIGYCLETSGLKPEELDYVGFYEKPLLKFERLLETYLQYAPRGYRSFSKAMSVWLKQKQFVARRMREALGALPRNRFVFVEHHESHAASAFYPSPFEEAAILTLDGVGEWATGGYGSGSGNRIELTHSLRFPQSIGLLYSAFTYFTGFRVNSGEYKMMGLAPYGQPIYVDRILERLVDLKEDGSFLCDMSFFNYCQGLTMTSKKFDALFGGPPRSPGGPITQREMDIAASIQQVTEEILLRCARHVHRQTGLENLCMAGGVALNCVANGRILREGPFERLWVQPAAGDAGGALGLALFTWFQLLGNQRTPDAGDSQRGSLLGVEYDDQEIAEFLDGAAAHYEKIDDPQTLCERVAAALDRGKIVGWFQGRMEFGPRALGSRSILGDARNPRMQSMINQKVKFREGFRPFAPIVLAEHAQDYFALEPEQESPYMLLVAPVRPEKRLPGSAGERQSLRIDSLQEQRSVIPAVTHVDFSARVQTVDRGRHGLLRRLMEAFHRRTGCPVLVNTSFNLGWEPIVRTPGDAYHTFMSCELDMLCMGPFLLDKSAQPRWTDPRSETERLQWSRSRLRSPCCGEALREQHQTLACAACGRSFPQDEGIPCLFWPTAPHTTEDVTEKVKAFYEEAPFPNYDEHDSVRSLLDKSRRGRYAHLLEKAIPYNCDVLEVGCGTGQLANYLAIGCRRVVGTDICLNSLKLGEAFRRQHGLARAHFVQMNLFRPVFEPEAFDVILCNGVLHHTSDPRRGFECLLPLLKPGGYLVIGLYNRFGRLLTDLRRQLFRLTGGRGQWIDPYLRERGLGVDKRRAWFADQYRHPHESKHTFDEVLGWFDDHQIEFVNAVPALRPDDQDLTSDDLFTPHARGRRLERLIVQLSHIVTGQSEGGFFIMIGRKPGPAIAGTAGRQGVVAGGPALPPELVTI